MKSFAALGLFLFFASICLASPARYQDHIAEQIRLQNLAVAQRRQRDITWNRRLLLSQEVCLNGTLLSASLRAYRNLVPIAELMLKVDLDNCPDILSHYWFCIALSSVSLLFQLLFPLISHFALKKPMSKIKQFSGVASALEFLVLFYLFSTVGEESAIDGANLMFAGLSNLTVAGLTFIIAMSSLTGDFLC